MKGLHNVSDMTPEELAVEQRRLNMEEIRLGGREYLIGEITKYQDILAIYDAGQFEAYADGELQPLKH